MSGGEKRAEDKLNTIGIVVVGICGAVLVYVTIVGLEAFYVNDTSELQTMADYGGNDTAVKSLKAEQLGHITEYGSNPPSPGVEPTYHLKIERAMALVVESAKGANGGLLVPVRGPLKKADECAAAAATPAGSAGLMGCPTMLPIFGRPKPIPPPTPATPPPAPPAAAGSGSAAPTPGAGSAEAPAGAGSAAPAGAGSATPPAAGSNAR